MLWSIRVHRTFRHHYTHYVRTGILPCLFVLCALFYLLTSRYNEDTFHKNTRLKTHVDNVFRYSNKLKIPVVKLEEFIQDKDNKSSSLRVSGEESKQFDNNDAGDESDNESVEEDDNIIANDNLDKDKIFEDNADDSLFGVGENRNGFINKEKSATNSLKGRTILFRNMTNDTMSDSGSRFEFAANLGKQAHDKIIELIGLDKAYLFEVGLGGENGQEIQGGGGGGDEFPAYVERGKKDGPGEHGEPVRIPKRALSLEERMKKESDYKVNYFDVWISRMISVHRQLDDARSERCRQQSAKVTSFPPVSVVMVFYNEAWSTLLRSIHSVLDRTPVNALLEIVLLDDASDQEHLAGPLEKYLGPLKKVRLVRSKKRLGLIKARNLGFLYAKGDIIVFLDSHIECFPGWLEPLVTPIVLDPRTVTFPSIPTIDKRTFGVATPSTEQDPVYVGNVNIHSLMFYWTPIKNTKRLYYESPAMPGGLYAISRKWFQHLGAYDPLLMFWGGENVEISFKTWMCGGRILLSMCSWVGHVFRTKSPLKKEDYLTATPRNSNRVAEVWMDQFKHFYFEKFDYKMGPVGDVSVQKDLRRGLMCKSFGWYLDNVNTVLKTQIDSRSVYFGKVTNKMTGTCLSHNTKTDSLSLTHCDDIGFLELWNLRTSGHLQCYDKLASISVNTNSTSYILTMMQSTTKHTEQLMSFDYGASHHLVHRESQRCLDIDTSSQRYPVVLSECRDDVISQVWTLQPRMQYREFHKNISDSGIEW